MAGPTDLYRELVDDIAAPLAAWLAERGVDEPPALGPPTREGAGDLALPCHPWARVFRKAPQAIAADLAAVAEAHPLVASAEAVAGFLNLRFDWGAVARRVLEWAETDDGAIGRSTALAGERRVIEFSSPNTNKPLHVGHARNNVLGEAVSALVRAVGGEVVKVNLINDRGIHICKSMVAYQLFGAGVTPEKAGVKGDHLVGDLYVKFEQAFAEEYARHCPDGAVSKEDWFNGGSELGRRAREMLQAWEAGDPEVRALWKMMNGWCEAGFDQTYARMGVTFDRIDRESETYLLGKDLVEEGLAKGVFRRLEDGAVVFDLERIGLEGHKVVLRGDGTSVYVTQDLGTAVRRHEEIGFDEMIYVVGNEQDRHFQVLFGILGELRSELKNRLRHLSYGMVELPAGKMKSREGTVVDADDLMDELHETAFAAARERYPDLDDDELHRRAEAIALGGLKFFLLKFAPQTTFIFDKDRSVSIEGETGAYCQYAYARAGSILRKLGDAADDAAPDYAALTLPQERDVMTAMLRFPGEVRAAALDLKPNLVAKATFDLARTFAAFFNHPEARVIDADPPVRAARAALVRAARRMLRAGLELMGITPLEEM